MVKRRETLFRSLLNHPEGGDIAAEILYIMTGEGKHTHTAKAPDWVINVKPRMVKVSSLMTGKEIEIEARLQGTACDPSQERYWST